MRDHTSHIELTRETAIGRLVEAARFAPETETVVLHEAHMRVTAAECRAKVDVPNALCAQMDGIAVRYDDFAGGIPDTSGWQLGREYCWANTGTALPAGFDCTVPIEQVQKILGHSQIDTTMQYAIVNQSNVKSSHQRFIA